MTPEVLVNQLKSSKEYLDRATSALTEDDSTFSPDEKSFSVAQQLGHIAQTVDWFVEGAFGEGFNMDFESHDLQARSVTSLADARKAVNKSYTDAITLIQSKTAEEMLEPMAEGPVMGGEPKLGIVWGILDHTAHHRGSLSVYTRLRGKVPPMPYMDADAMA